MDKKEAGRLGYLKTKGLLEAHCRAKTEVARAAYTEANPHCRNCGDKIPYEKRENVFCNRSCRTQHNNRKRAKPRPTCLGCDNPVRTKHAQFCSGACHQQVRRQETDAKILADGNVHPHLKSPQTVKSFLLRQRGHRCSVCDLTEWRGNPAPLVMDHINGDSSDGALINLRLVCGNCDMQLPTYKSKNRGKGRHTRRVRYAEGKSF